MRASSRFAFALTAVFVAPLAAQDNCPMQAAQSVPQSISYGPDQDCGGVKYRLSEFEVTVPNGRCPLFVVITPAHDQAVPSPARTRVEVAAAQPVTMTVFECQKSYFLIIRIDSSCVMVRQSNIGTVHKLLTVPCDDPAP